jgi:hypothetical protein
MKLRSGQLYLLHSGHVVLIEKVTDCYVEYNINGVPVKVLKNAFLEKEKEL